jgi:predicted nucleic acid-binding protein
MARRVLDTNILINFWNTKVRGKRLRDFKRADAMRWGNELIKLQGTDAILTPIYLEYVCGEGHAHAVTLARAYLQPFDLVDEGRILEQDWDEAKRIAQRVLPDNSPRQMGDCLIRAICKRLHIEIFTADRRFPD